MVIPTFFNTTLHAEPCVAPIPGENLWRLTSRIGTCLDILISQMEDCCSTLEVCCHETISTIESTSDVLCTCVNTHTDSVADALEASICDCVDIAAASMSDAVCSCIDIAAASVADAVCDCIDNAAASTTEAVCSCVDSTLLSISDVLTSKIESTSDIVCICVNTHTDSVADALEASICDCVDSAAASVADAVCSCVDHTLLSVSDVLTSLIDRAQCCPNLITSVPFTITTPGHYCLANSVSYSVAAGFTAITIDSDDVVLDLNDNIMQRTVANTNAATTGAVVCNGRNCIIQNGVIDSDNIIATISAEKVTIRNIQIDSTIAETDSGGGGINFHTGANFGAIENCSVQNKANPGIFIQAGFVLIKNCQVYNCPQGIFITTGGNEAQIIDCIGSNNTFNGFVIGAPEVVARNCLASNNGDTGFNINQPDASISYCTSQRHTNGSGNGFLVDNGGDRATLTHNLAQGNLYGYRINNIEAEANFSGGAPVNKTWNIGAFIPILNTTTSRRIRLAYNVASQNTTFGYQMFGTVSSNNTADAPQAFNDNIYPPIGLVNSYRGFVQPNDHPAPETIVNAACVDNYGNVVTAAVTNAEGGNYNASLDASFD
jgi:hypothetical protein